MPSITIAPASISPEQLRELKRPQRDSSGRFVRRPQHPTIKNIWKWAESIFEENKNSRKLSNLIQAPPEGYKPSDIELCYLRFIASYKRWSYFRERSSNELRFDEVADRVYRESTSIAERIRFTREFTQYRAANLRNRPPAMTCKVSDLFNDMLNLCKAVPVFWNGTEKCLQLVTEPITLISPNDRTIRYQFGSFQLRFGMNMKNIFDIKIVANTPRLARNTQNQITHPHVRNQILCYGTGEQAAKKAWNEGRFYDITDLIMGVLRNYGATMGQRPFSTLESWNGVCDERFNPATGLTIGIDEQVIIPAVFVDCGRCGDRYEESQIVQCWQDGCHNTGCMICIQRCVNAGCSNRVCSDHLWTCEECEMEFCSDCFNRDRDLCYACCVIVDARDEAEDEEQE